jgi:cell division protein FtsW
MIFKNFKFDYILAATALILLFLGILVLASVSTVVSQDNFGNTTHYLWHQIIYGIIPGLALGILFYFLPVGFFKKWAWAAIGVNLFFMLLVFLPGLGIIAGGAPRWLNLKFFSFQPSEFLKLSFIIYIATWLSNPIRKTNLKKYTLIPFLVSAGFIALLLAKQSDLGTLGVIAFTAGIMYFTAETPLSHIVVLLFMGISCLVALVASSTYRMTRLKVMLGLIEDPMGLGYHIKQIFIAIGSGGIFGAGLGMSVQKFGFVPQTMSDSVFSIYAEETGLAGGIFLIVLYLMVLWRSVAISKFAKDEFSKLFALGFASWLCVQAFVNMSSMTGLIPLTGIPLPFISYGGTHIIAELAGMGILLNISRNLKK